MGRRKDNLQLRREIHKDGGETGAGLGNYLVSEMGPAERASQGGLCGFNPLRSASDLSSILWERDPYLLETESSPRVRIFHLQAPSV